MDDREPRRKIRHRLAVLRNAEEVSGNVAATCRHYGISRTLFYWWRNRFDEVGPEGLRDRSSRSPLSSTATKGEVVERIVGLHQNCHFGPARIAMYLKCCHEVEILDRGIGHACIKPATPRLNGGLERSHRIVSEESCRLLGDVTIDDTDMPNNRLPAWDDYLRLRTTPKVASAAKPPMGDPNSRPANPDVNRLRQQHN